MSLNSNKLQLFIKLIPTNHTQAQLDILKLPINRPLISSMNRKCKDKFYNKALMFLKISLICKTAWMETSDQVIGTMPTKFLINTIN